MTAEEFEIEMRRLKAEIGAGLLQMEWRARLQRHPSAGVPVAPVVQLRPGLQREVG